MSPKTPSAAPEAVAVPDPASYISDRLEWMELRAESVTGDERTALISEIAVEWKRVYGLSDSTEKLAHFLNGFLTKSARIQRGIADGGKQLMKIILAAHEPISMALGTPDSPIPEFWRGGSWPPSQADFDRRLAIWLRTAILNRDTKSLHLLAGALERIPKACLQVGIDFNSFMQRVNLPSLLDDDMGKKPSPLTRYVRAFTEIFSEKGRLPTTGELDAIAGTDDLSDCRSYRKKLGYQNLPRSSRTH